jgi:hypothetical protein
MFIFSTCCIQEEDENGREEWNNLNDYLKLEMKNTKRVQKIYSTKFKYGIWEIPSRRKKYRKVQYN